MDLRGIMLLDLCVWSLLEGQSVRKETYRRHNCEAERMSFEIDVAITWKAQALGDSGDEYAKTVDRYF